jgi:hypothetical protein
MLLLLVAAGVAFMHTLGHPSGAGGHANGTTHRAAHAAPVMPDAPIAAEVTGDDPLIGFDPMAVCLAVLLGGFVLVLAALILARRRAAAGQTRAWSARAANVRAPPGAMFGLRLANLSVLRT